MLVPENDDEIDCNCKTVKNVGDDDEFELGGRGSDGEEERRSIDGSLSSLLSSMMTFSLLLVLDDSREEEVFEHDRDTHERTPHAPLNSHTTGKYYKIRDPSPPNVIMLQTMYV